MPTLSQAVERARMKGRLPPSGPVTLAQLRAIFAPPIPNSIRSLLETMAAEVTEPIPWLVILCRFKDDNPGSAIENPVESLYRRMFSCGTDGLVEYWRDVSLGAINIAGSKVMGWINVDLNRKDAGVGSGIDRVALADLAAKAVGPEKVKGYRGPIAVYVRNWSSEEVPNGTNGIPNFADPTDPRIPYWIDGSAQNGRITLTPPHNGNICAHEMGHLLGLGHDHAPDLKTPYGDPCCIMSQNAPFNHPLYGVNFGPALCLCHLVQKGWMYNHRIIDGRDWQARPGGISVQLAAVNDPCAEAGLGLTLSFSSRAGSWDYWIEYVPARGWNRGLIDSMVFIRRFGTIPDGSTQPVYLDYMHVRPGGIRHVEVIEPSGNVRFKVRVLDAGERIVQVDAEALRISGAGKRILPSQKGG